MMKVEVVVPQEYMGDVINDLNSRRGRVGTMELRGGSHVVSVFVPLSEMFGYATTMRSLSQGRATYTMHFERYEQVPAKVADELLTRGQGRLLSGSRAG